MEYLVRMNRFSLDKGSLGYAKLTLRFSALDGNRSVMRFT
jgi:hypothetical protein